MDSNMISLSFSMESNKNVYALLLGSGISFSAGIPTGWKVLSELCNRLMQLQGGLEDDAISWYEKEYGMKATYDEVLELLAKSSSERNGLLREFFEPTSEEQEEGVKTPTQAHKAIAELVYKGFIKVIITTNFDRLIEHALDTLNIQYQTLYHDSDIEGMKPIAHVDCTVIKVHGDYRDMRFKNITNELKDYSAELTSLLKQIFNDHGVIVSGWSAEWDNALRNTIRGVKGRRYSWYWHSFSENLNRFSNELVEYRDANVIVDNKGADHFFYQLKENVLSINQNKRINPVTLEMKISRIKKLLNQNKKIEINDIITDATKTLLESMNSFDPEEKSKSGGDLAKEWILKIDELSKDIVSLLTIIAYYEADSFEKLLIETLERLTKLSKSRGNATLLKVKEIPLQYAFYGITMALVKSKNIRILKNIMTKPKVRTQSYYLKSFEEHISPSNGFHLMAKNVNVSSNYYLPFEELILRPFLLKCLLVTGVWIDEQELDASYDIFEFLRTMYQKFQGKEKNYLYGRFAYKEDNNALKSFLLDGKEEKNDWKVLELFENKQEYFEVTLKKCIDDFSGKSDINFSIASYVLKSFFEDGK